MYDPNGRAAAAIHQRGSAKPRTKPERGITAHTPTASAARRWDCSIAPRRDFDKPRYSTEPDHKEVDVLLAANGVWIWTTLAIINAFDRHARSVKEPSDRLRLAPQGPAQGVRTDRRAARLLLS
jgi:hypothetical protein